MMPKIEGRPDTRKRIPLEMAMLAGYLMPWERNVYNKPCCIEGCEHRCGGNQGTLAEPDWESCGHGNAAIVYDERLMPGPTPDPHVGTACPCCVDKIHALDDGA
jgi:hypothetical protein